MHQTTSKFVPIKINIKYHPYKVCTRVAAGSYISVDIYANNCLITYHTLFLSIVVGSIGNDLTCYILIGIDFTINMLMLAQVLLHLWKSDPQEKFKAKEDLQVI